MSKWLARLAAIDATGEEKNAAPPLAPHCQNRQNPVLSVLAVGREGGSEEISAASGPLADPATPCTTCGCGAYWHAADGWHCECCEPAPATVTRWRTVSGGTVAPMPAPAIPWPPELTDTLRRVAEHFEWSRADIADFCRWARRSPEALADAAKSLRGWAAAT